MGTIRVLSPVVDSKVSQSAPLRLPGTLAGKRLGFLDNTKANFELLLRRMEARLRADVELADVVYERKANSSTPAAPEILARLRDVDLVVTGSAD
jgi:pseudouridine-5'-phosphate glycosidase